MINLSKVLPVEDRTFTKVFQMMKAKRKSMPQDALAGFRKRRTSAGAIFGLNLPPLPEPEIPIETDKNSESDIDQGDADEAHAEAEL